MRSISQPELGGDYIDELPGAESGGLLFGEHGYCDEHSSRVDPSGELNLSDIMKVRAENRLQFENRAGVKRRMKSFHITRTVDGEGRVKLESECEHELIN